MNEPDAFKILRDSGLKQKGGVIMLEKSLINYPEELRDAIWYLCEEWDYAVEGGEDD